MTRASRYIALCSAMPVAAQGSVPEWVHLLPAGEIRTADGRGPYRVTSMQGIASMLRPGDKLPIDENHATDKGGATLGMPAPARGWIVALQARNDGLWGKVEWTGTGRQLMADKAYAGISPVILHGLSGDVKQVLRASLTNVPNLQGLTSLHSQQHSPIAPMKLPSLVKEDRLVMSLFGMSEADYRAALGAVGLQKQTMAAQSKPVAASDFHAADRLIMRLFSINESDYGAKLAAAGLKKQSF